MCVQAFFYLQLHPEIKTWVKIEHYFNILVSFVFNFFAKGK